MTQTPEQLAEQIYPMNFIGGGITKSDRQLQQNAFIKGYKACQQSVVPTVDKNWLGIAKDYGHYADGYYTFTEEALMGFIKAVRHTSPVQPVSKAEPPKEPDEDYFTDNDDDNFQPCERCDGHEACRDFGCAFDLGLGEMVETDLYS